MLLVSISFAAYLSVAQEHLSTCTRISLTQVRDRSGFKPFMEYAGSYALFNYCLADPSVGMDYSNLRLVRAFEKGLNPSSSEAGFVLVHVDMVKNSGLLVEGAVKALAACANDDRKAFDAGLELVIKAMVEVNRVMNGKFNSHSVDSKVKEGWIDEIDIVREICGRKVCLATTTAFALSYLASRANRCFLMAWSMKV